MVLMHLISFAEDGIYMNMGSALPVSLGAREWLLLYGMETALGRLWKKSSKKCCEDEQVGSMVSGVSSAPTDPVNFGP